LNEAIAGSVTVATPEFFIIQCHGVFSYGHTALHSCGRACVHV
jgi:hypothetical protein